jgi:hypothetical protein
MANHEQKKANASKWGKRLASAVIVIQLMRLFIALVSGDINKIVPAILVLIVGPFLFYGIGYVLGYALGGKNE